MQKLQHYSNWCEIDRLDGKDLQDGEKLRIKWPDGTITVEKVSVKKRTMTTSEQGGSYDIPISEAFLEFNDNHRGLQIKKRIKLNEYIDELLMERA